ncbi:hypothetical protein THAOC_06271, partial [Thalassiosira oceanica]
MKIEASDRLGKVALSNALGLERTELASGRPGRPLKREIVEILPQDSVRECRAGRTAELDVLVVRMGRK